MELSAICLCWYVSATATIRIEEEAEWPDRHTRVRSDPRHVKWFNVMMRDTTMPFKVIPDLKLRRGFEDTVSVKPMHYSQHDAPCTVSLEHDGGELTQSV